MTARTESLHLPFGCAGARDGVYLAVLLLDAAGVAAIASLTFVCSVGTVEEVEEEGVHLQRYCCCC